MPPDAKTAATAPKKAGPLTDADCKNKKAPRDVGKWFDGYGMYLEVTPLGAKYWRLKYRFAGKEKRLALGVYPEVTLKAAREQRDEARKLLRDGVDPSEHKKGVTRAREQEKESSFEAVARAWWEEWRKKKNDKTGFPKSARHADYVMRRLEADIFPKLGYRPVDQILPSEIKRLIKGISSRGVTDLAYRAHFVCRQVLRYAVSEDLAERNAAADLKLDDFLPGRTKKNYARLGASELPELLRKIEGYEGTAVTRLAMKLMALTFVRTSELIGAQWDEFDFAGKQWRIPAKRMKMREVHIVPLSRQALEVLAVLQTINGQRPLLFPGERDHAKPISNNTILGALKRMGYAGRMTGHGFRGIASTALHEMGFAHDHIERQLAHGPRDPVSASYNYAQYLKDRTNMMQAWADYLDKLRKGGDVLPFGSKPNQKKRAAA